MHLPPLCVNLLPLPTTEHQPNIRLNQPEAGRKAAGTMASRLESANAAQISQAMGFTETVTKSGYLVKRAKQSERNWKKRYFVLSGQSLTYYENNKKLTVAKGNFLLTNGTVVEPVTGDKSYDHCFEIRSEFETMRMAAASPEEAEEWTSALTSTIAEINSSTRAYMDVQEKGMFGNKWARRFVMLHSNSITYHQDHMHTFKALGTVKLTSEMVVIANEASLRVKEVHKARDEIHLRPSSEESDPTSILVTWKSAIEASVRGISEASDLAVKPGETNNEVTTIDGHLLAQTAKHKWVPRFFALTTTALYMAEDDKAMEALAVFPLSPSCSVFETNLRPNAFELVTPQGALHVAANDQESTKRWIAQFRHVIGNSKVSRNDPLLCGALNKEMSQYDVNFTTKKPLGIVLERSREWALVKLANSEVSDVSEGSALAKINGKSVLLTEYNKTIKMLAGWQPPLQLTFIRGPDKKGWLEKMSRGRRRAVKNWKRRYFILKQGKVRVSPPCAKRSYMHGAAGLWVGMAFFCHYHDCMLMSSAVLVLVACMCTCAQLAYYTMEGDVPELKGCVQLMGSAVSLIPFDEVGHNFCFRLVSGVATLVMRAETVEEMMDWATDLYHAIAIANGGGYLLEIQRKIEAKEEAERVRIAKEKAKVEAEERKHAAVEAERRRLEMEEAARREAEEAAIEQARLEAEEAARAASQAALEAENVSGPIRQCCASPGWF